MPTHKEDFVMTADQEKRLLSLVVQSNFSQERCKEILESCDWDVFKAYNLLAKISYEEYMKKQDYVPVIGGIQNDF